MLRDSATDRLYDIIGKWRGVALISAACSYATVVGIVAVVGIRLLFTLPSCIADLPSR